MKTVYVALFVFTYFQLCHVSTGLECYQCVYYDGLEKDHRDELKPETACKENPGTLDPFLKPCQTGGNETCTLIHLNGKNRENKEFQLTVRDCLPVQRDLKVGQCADMNGDRFKRLPFDDTRVVGLLRNHDAKGKACTCQSKACNKDIKTTEGKGSAIVPTVFIVGLFSFITVSSFSM